MKKLPDFIIDKNEHILLHVCCAPCAAGCVERLIAAYKKVTLFYSNSNLIDQNEFDLRLKYVYQLAEYYNLPVIADEYNHSAWQDFTAGFAEAPEGGARCGLCFKFSLQRTAIMAEQGDFDVFATSLTVSPKKSSSLIFELGRHFPKFRPWNFKKQSGYLLGTQLSKQLDFYRQNFCGCEYSFSASPVATRPMNTPPE